jgi:hypothetical protein
LIVTGDITITVAICLIMAVAGFAIWRRQRDAIPRIRRRLEDQGLTVERLAPAHPGVVAMVNEQYGRSKYVTRRVYSVLANDNGVSTKQSWMVENGRLVRIS